MKCVIYSRCSTAGQDVTMQLDECRSYAQRRGLTVVGEYIDAGISGSKENRPQLSRLLTDMKRRNFDVLLCFRYDRVARSLRQLCNILADCDALGVSFVSLHEGTDTSTATGRLIFGIFASIAEFERELIRMRVRSGQAAARRRGVQFGRPKIAVDTAKVKELRDQGLSFAAISQRTGLSVGTVYRAVGG